MCVLSLPRTGQVWRQVEEQILTHLRRYDISAATADIRQGDIYFNSPMFLIHPYRNSRQVLRRPFVESDLTASTFNVVHLEKASQMAKDPEGNDNLLFFGQPTCVHDTRYTDISTFCSTSVPQLVGSRVVSRSCPCLLSMESVE